jgi:hypothetical protein
LGEKENYRRAVIVGTTLVVTAVLLSGFLWNVAIELGLAQASGSTSAADSWWGVAWAGFPVVGMMILLHRRANTVGRLLLFTGTCMAIVTATHDVLLDPTPRGPVLLEMPAMLAGALGWIGLIGVVVAFPSGFDASKGARVLSRLLCALAVWITFLNLVSPRVMDSERPNPLRVGALEGLSSWFVEGPGFLVVPTLVLLTLISQTLRWRRSTGVVRLQYRWFIAGVAVALAAIATLELLPTGDDETLQFGLVNLLWALPMNAIAVAIGIAVSRYRLYELDRLVSRTVSYALVSLTLIAVYVGVITLASGLLPDTADGPVVAVATLTAAAMFRPVLTRVQGLVDRRFNQQKYDGQMAMERFADRMRHQVQPVVVSEELLTALEQTVRPSAVALWTREPVT